VIVAVLKWRWPITTTAKGLCRFCLLIRLGAKHSLAKCKCPYWVICGTTHNNDPRSSQILYWKFFLRTVISEQANVSFQSRIQFHMIRWNITQTAHPKIIRIRLLCYLGPYNFEKNDWLSCFKKRSQIIYGCVNNPFCCKFCTVCILFDGYLLNFIRRCWASNRFRFYKRRRHIIYGCVKLLFWVKSIYLT
jgi:hypothetical protein